MESVGNLKQLENVDLLPVKQNFNLKKKLTAVPERKQSSRASQPGADKDKETVVPGADQDDYALLGAIPKRKVETRTRVPSRKIENMYESHTALKYDFNVGFKMDEGCPEKSIRIKLLEREEYSGQISWGNIVIEDAVGIGGGDEVNNHKSRDKGCPRINVRKNYCVKEKDGDYKNEMY